CAACSPKSSGGSQAAGSPSGLLRARPFSVSLGWCGLCAYRFLLWRLHPAAPDIIFLTLDDGVAYRDNGRRCGKTFGLGNFFERLSLPKPGVQAARLPWRQGGKGLPEPFHRQGACGLLFPFRFLLHQNILRGNGLLREMVFRAGGCVQRVTVIM